MIFANKKFRLNCYPFSSKLKLIFILYKMNRKTFGILVIFFLYLFTVTLSAQGTWEVKESPTGNSLQSVSFADSLYGWAVGDSGTIINTTDGGDSWMLQDSHTENKIVNVFFLNRNLGWASSWNISVVPFGTVLLKTTNGGEEWNLIPYRERDLFINCILFTDSLTGWLGGSPHTFVKSTDGGISWRHAYIDSATFVYLPVLDIEFYDSNYGFACGGTLDNPSVMWKTSNGGDVWYASRQTGVPDQIREIHVFDSLNVIGVGGDFEITGVGVIRTSDGGLSWDYKPVNISGVTTDLAFRNDREAWATISSLKSFMYSLDSGRTWTQKVISDSLVVNDICFTDSSHGFAVGNKGAILKYKPSKITDVIQKGEIKPVTFSLQQNYPNPFNPSSKIKYKIPSSFPLLNKEGNEGWLIKLKVYDVLGNEIATLVNEEQSAGNYEVEFNAGKFPGGVYFYRLQADDYTKTMKMLLLK